MRTQLPLIGCSQNIHRWRQALEEFSMIVDMAAYVWSFPCYRDLSGHLWTAEDPITFRTFRTVLGSAADRQTGSDTR